MAEFIQHTVENNETLRSLAVKYNTTTANLAQINHITSTAYIFPGMQLKVPNIGLKISSIEFSTQNLKLTESAQNLLTTSQNEKLVDVGSGTAGTSTAKNATDSTTSASSQPLTSSNSDKSSQHLSDILNVNFSTSLPTTSNFLKKNMSESEAQTRQKSQNAPSHEQPPSANQQLMTENAGFIKLQAVLLPADIKGTLIITNSALMFDPLDDNLRKFSNITALEETSWIECVRVPKATQTSQKLEEQFPMVNSIMRSFSDYFEESNDSSFDFILMKLSMDLSKSIDFTYFKFLQSDVNQLFNILSDLKFFKYQIGPSIQKDRTYSEFYKTVKLAYPNLQGNWFLLNDKMHHIVEHQFRLQQAQHWSSQAEQPELIGSNSIHITNNPNQIGLPRFQSMNRSSTNADDIGLGLSPADDGYMQITTDNTKACSVSSNSSIYLPELVSSSGNFTPAHILGDLPVDSEAENPADLAEDFTNSLNSHRTQRDPQEILKQLTKWLPDECAGVSTWKLIFSSDKQGHSLNTLYRVCSLEKYSKSMNILLIESTDGSIFGSFLTELPHKIETHQSKKFYGSGESFLFKFGYRKEKSEINPAGFEGSKNQAPNLIGIETSPNTTPTNSKNHTKSQNLKPKNLTNAPRFGQKFAWTGENNFVATGDVDHFAVGGGKGKHGLWLDSRLCMGSSQPCDTFDNDILSSQRDFTISSLELWVLE